MFAKNKWTIFSTLIYATLHNNPKLIETILKYARGLKLDTATNRMKYSLSGQLHCSSTPMGLTSKYHNLLRPVT